MPWPPESEGTSESGTKAIEARFITPRNLSEPDVALVQSLGLELAQHSNPKLPRILDSKLTILEVMIREVYLPGGCGIAQASQYLLNMLKLDLSFYF